MADNNLPASQTPLTQGIAAYLQERYGHLQDKRGDYVGLPKIAKRLGVSQKTVLLWVQTCGLPAYQWPKNVGGVVQWQWRICDMMLMVWLAGLHGQTHNEVWQGQRAGQRDRLVSQRRRDRKAISTGVPYATQRAEPPAPVCMDALTPSGAPDTRIDRDMRV